MEYRVFVTAQFEPSVVGQYGEPAEVEDVGMFQEDSSKTLEQQVLEHLNEFSEFDPELEEGDIELEEFLPWGYKIQAEDPDQHGVMVELGVMLCVMPGFQE
jgi:hypothetical protein